MEDPNLIATLIPVDTIKRAKKTFYHKKNELRYLPPTQEIPEGPIIFNWEATLTLKLFNNDYLEYDFTHWF